MMAFPPIKKTLEGLLEDLLVRMTLVERRLAKAGGGGGGGGAYDALPGMLQSYAGGPIPSGWLVCDGTAVPRQAYPELFAAIGVLWGAGNGSTTFNLPDLRGRTVVGRDISQVEFDVVGETGGAKTHTLTTAEIPAHVHGTRIDATATAFGTAGSGGYSRPTGTLNNTLGDTASAGGGGPHNNMPPYGVANWMISTGSTIGGGGSNVPALPAPQQRMALDTVNADAGAALWKDVPLSEITYTLAQPMWVNVDFSGQLTTSNGGVYGMIGVRASGALVLAPEVDQATGNTDKYGLTPFSLVVANVNQYGSKHLLLPAGTTTLTMTLRRSTTAVVPVLNYAKLAVTPLAWVGAPGPVIEAPAGLITRTPVSVVGGSLFGSKVNFTNVVTVSLNGVFTPEYDEYVIEAVITSKSANGGGWFRLRAAGVDDAGANTYGMQADYNNGPSTPATSYSTSDGFAFAVVPFTQAAKMTWKLTGPAQGSYQKMSHIATLGQVSGAILNMDIKGSKGGPTIFDGFSLVSSTGTITGYLRVYALT